MSHTEVYDHKAAERRQSNEINRAVRHCRIGKIKWKRAAYAPYAPTPKIFGPYIDPINTPMPRPISTDRKREWWELPPMTGAPAWRPYWWDQVTC